MNQPSQEFPAAPMDRSTKLTTAALIAAIAGLMLSVPALDAGATGVLFGWVVPVVLVLLAYGFSPAGYQLAPGMLRIRRRWFGGRRFRIDDVEATSALFGLGGLRLAGSGGAFGWYGLFWRKSTGRYHAYVTDRARLVTCTGSDGLVVVSPQDPEAFVSAAQP